MAFRGSPPLCELISNQNSLPETTWLLLTRISHQCHAEESHMRPSAGSGVGDGHGTGVLEVFPKRLVTRSRSPSGDPPLPGAPSAGTHDSQGHEEDSWSVHPNIICNRGELLATGKSPVGGVRVVLLRGGSQSPPLEPRRSCDSPDSRGERVLHDARPGFTSPTPPHPASLVLGTHVVWEPGHMERPHGGVLQLTPASAADK